MSAVSGGSGTTAVIEITGPMSDIFDIPGNGNVYVWFPHASEDDTEANAKPYLAYWHDGRWEWSHATNHTVVSREPLTLTASIGWPDKHGWITDGQWIDA